VRLLKSCRAFRDRREDGRRSVLFVTDVNRDIIHSRLHPSCQDSLWRSPQTCLIAVQDEVIVLSCKDPGKLLNPLLDLLRIDHRASFEVLMEQRKMIALHNPITFSILSESDGSEIFTWKCV
jgi:hypothetical protein